MLLELEALLEYAGALYTGAAGEELLYEAGAVG